MEANLRRPISPNAVLALDPVERRKSILTAFNGSAERLPLFDFTCRDWGFSYQFEYSLKPDYQDQLESLHEQTREDLGLARLQQSYEEAISRFKQSLPAEAYDESVAQVQLTIDFNQTDQKLKEAFATMLKATRRTTKRKPPQHRELNAKLVRLAASRLWRVFHTTEAAAFYVSSQGFENPYKNAGSWSRARTEVWKTLGAKAFPSDEVDSTKVA